MADAGVARPGSAMPVGNSAPAGSNGPLVDTAHGSSAASLGDTAPTGAGESLSSRMEVPTGVAAGATVVGGALAEELTDDPSLASLEVKGLDSGSQYALEHSGIGPADLLVDCAGLLAAAVLVVSARVVDHALGEGALAVVTTFARLALSIPIFAAVLVSTRRRSLLNPVFSEQIHVLALPVAAGGLVVLTAWILARIFFGIVPPNVDWVLAMTALSLPGVAGARVIHHRLRSEDPGRVHRVLIVGSGQVADRVSNWMSQTSGVEVVGCVDDDPVDPDRCLGRLSSLSGVCAREGVSHIVVAFTRSSTDAIIEALRPMQGRLPITVVPRLFEVLPTTARMHEIGSGLSGLSVAPAALGPWSRMVKFTVDITASAIGLLLLSPLLLVVALAVRLTSRGPVLFRQARIGRNGRQFWMLKFRTMHVERSDVSPASLEGEVVAGPFVKLKRDPRITPLGRFLRHTSLDELPQLWNVLRGEMSLVGPRPFMLEDAAIIEGWALRRYSVRPGITGLWQVSGRNELTFAEMCRLDQLYVNCWSLGLDVRILLRTLWVVLGGHGAY
jgi:exopolysaccharide biosynthesis polyprenyl glycosylphosphotransferase